MDFRSKVAQNSGMGQFQSGQPKPSGSGRKRGSKNKKSLELEAAFSCAGLDVPSRLVELLPSLSPDRQADILLDLMAYLYPGCTFGDDRSSPRNQAQNERRLDRYPKSMGRNNRPPKRNENTCYEGSPSAGKNARSTR